MGTDRDASTVVDLPLAGGRFCWSQLAVWLLGSPIIGILAAWVAARAQFYFAPLILFPILVGIGLGAMLVGFARVAQIGNRPTIFTGAVLAVLLTIVGEHYISYIEVQRRQQAEDDETLAKARQAFPEMLRSRKVEESPGFLDYMRGRAERGRPIILLHKAPGVDAWRGWAAWASWAVDGLLVLIAAIFMLIPAARQPYCNRCQSWYRTIRSGRVPETVARQLAEAAHATLGPQVKSARYRLSNCSSGCGMTRLELSWEEADGRTLLNVLWLDGGQREMAGRALDAAKREG